jgi:hypothetical protein
MDNSIPKSIKKQLKKFSAEAYERESSISLEKLYGLFVQWKKGKIRGAELIDKVFEYNNGAFEKLFEKYNTLDDDVLVGFAVGNKLFTEDEIPKELLPYIEKSIKLHHELNKES